MEEKNIKDDADLIREFAKYDFDKKYGVFTSISKLREDYSIRLIASIALPSVDKIYYINGVHKGYMFELVNEEKGNKLYEVNLFKDPINLTKSTPLLYSIFKFNIITIILNIIYFLFFLNTFDIISFSFY